ncbi:Imm52 family immunity protein [Salinicola endophyticus]|uniref:Imm52 family immunity protein n=1 Tax=Salinicola endophyticus TaxID=1949083 RepID=UPI000DA1A6C5|nr:Imm52 family immunity protein [Salinicola endophyticus]
MSYAGSVLRFMIPPVKEPMTAEVVYDHWIAMLDAINQEDLVLSQWRYADDDRGVLLDVHERARVVQLAISDVRQFNHNYKGVGLISFTSYGNFSMEEKKYHYTENGFSWGGGGSGAFFIDTGLLKQTDWPNYWQVFANCLRHLAGVIPPQWADVAPRRYRPHAAFPHRMWVGWMALVPDVDLSNEMPFVALAEYLPGIGTLIVTTKEPFDPDNEEHIKLARATEVFLADRGLLPERGV